MHHLLSIQTFGIAWPLLGGMCRRSLQRIPKLSKPPPYAASRGLYNFKATLAYRGTAYKGWQIQRSAKEQPTVQGTIGQAIRLLKEEPLEVLDIQGAGRTDAGVHARGQVFNFYSRTLTPPPERFARAINSFLPEDIRVLAVERVPTDFHARHSALSKTYSFHLQQGQIADPLLSGLSQHVFQTLDLPHMQAAAKLFVGTHDFTQFASIGNTGTKVPGWKTLTEAAVHRAPNGLMMVFSGSGFLYNQCRHMAGCLIRVGMGSMSLDAVEELLRVGSQHGLRHRPWTLATAGGLYLERVQYPDHSNYDVLMHPEAPHDKYGRVAFDGIDAKERVRIQEILRQKKAAQFSSMANAGVE